MNFIYKKGICAAIAIVIAVCCMTAPLMVSAQEPVKLSVSNVVGEPGKDVIVSVNISPNSGIATLDFILKYDNSKLFYKSYKKGSAAEGGLFSLNPNYKNLDGSSALKQAFAHPEGVTAEGSIVDITFTVVPGWSGSTSIVMEITDDINDTDYQTVLYEKMDGSVTVGDDTIPSSVTTESSAANSDESEMPSSKKTLALILLLCGVLAVGVFAAFFIKKK